MSPTSFQLLHPTAEIYVVSGFVSSEIFGCFQKGGIVQVAHLRVCVSGQSRVRVGSDPLPDNAGPLADALDAIPP